ncbi:MAG: PIG-L deacetylase family protein [Candidatus Promineifilaceae bacterium]
MSSTFVPERAMFIYAHPDDIEFGVAGTAAKWTKGGCQVTYVLLTDGNVGSHVDGMSQKQLAQIRRQEQTDAANVVGAKCVFLGHDDGLLEPTLAIRKELVRLIREYQPVAVVCGDPTVYFPSENYINHPDHRAAAQLALDAVFPASEMSMLYPDLADEGLAGHKVNFVYVNWGTENNTYIDISDTIDLKIEALRRHESQLGDWDPEELVREWNSETGKKVGFDYAEAFRRIVLKPLDEEA